MKTKQATTSYQRGIAAENRAALYLRLKGYKILARRYKTRVGEIDIIARKKQNLVAVEVKTRKNMDHALESVSAKNQSRVARTLQYYVQGCPHLHGCTMRFDVIVYTPPFHFRHLDNAWREGA